MYRVNFLHRGGNEDILNQRFASAFRTPVHLLRTRSWVEEQLSLGVFEEGINITTIEEWNIFWPHLAVGTGELQVFSDSKPGNMLTHSQRMKVAWLIEHKEEFAVIDGLNMANLCFPEPVTDFDFFISGEGGRYDQLEKPFSELPSIPQNEVYIACRQYDDNRLWAAYCLYKDRRQDAYAWHLLKDLPVRWHQPSITVKELCFEQRAALNEAGSPMEGLPSPFELERALRLFSS